MLNCSPSRPLSAAAMAPPATNMARKVKWAVQGVRTGRALPAITVPEPARPARLVSMACTASSPNSSTVARIRASLKSCGLLRNAASA